MPVPTKMVDPATAASQFPAGWMPRHKAGRLPAGDPVDPARDAIQRYARLCLDRGRGLPFKRGSRCDQRHDDDQFVGDRVRWLLQELRFKRHHAVDRLS